MVHCRLNPQAGGPGLIPGQETRSCVPQLRPGVVKTFLRNKVKYSHIVNPTLFFTGVNNNVNGSLFI